MKNTDVRRIRFEYGLTQDELSKALHISQQCVWYWESGRRGLSHYHLVVMIKLQECLKNKYRKGVAKKALKISSETKGVRGLDKLLTLLFNA